MVKKHFEIKKFANDESKPYNSEKVIVMVKNSLGHEISDSLPSLDSDKKRLSDKALDLGLVQEH